MAKIFTTKNIARKANSETVAFFLQKKHLEYTIDVKGDFNLFTLQEIKILCYAEFIILQKDETKIKLEAPFFNSELEDAYNKL